MGKRNGSLIGKRNVGAGATNNASGIWGLNDTQRVMSPDNSSALKSKIQIQYLLVGGGGGGGGSQTGEKKGGGGGAGGMVEGTLVFDSGTQLYVRVGNGGSGGSGNDPGNTGNKSSLSTPNVDIDAWGGGLGKGYNSYTDNDGWGASGGGLDSHAAVTDRAIPGYVNQGNPGGQPYTGNVVSYPQGSRSAAGGGGAGDKGQDAGVSSAGDGGIGRMSYITNTGVYYAGGGGGGARHTHPAGNGGTGGGGAGGQAPNEYSNSAYANGNNGTVNTGGGGGGAATGANAYFPAPGTGGSGGPGVIILRFPQSVTFTETGGGSITYSGPSPVPGTVDERYYTFTQGANYITFTST